MNSNVITYLIASYNKSKYVEDCLNSLKEQTSHSWQCVICDDCSTDKSLEIIESALRSDIQSKITLIKNSSNIGYIKTLKRLIHIAETDIVGILDADDLLYPRATEMILRAYGERENAGFVYSKCLVFDETLTEVTGEFGALSPSGKTFLIPIGFGLKLLTFRKSVYLQTKGLDDEMLYSEDRDLVYKLEEVTSPIFIDQYLCKYRRVPDSQTTNLVQYEIGLLNHLKCRKNALRRRHVTGLENIFFQIIFHTTYCMKSHKHLWLSKVIAEFLLRSILHIDMLFSIVTRAQAEPSFQHFLKADVEDYVVSLKKTC